MKGSIAETFNTAGGGHLTAENILENIKAAAAALDEQRVPADGRVVIEEMPTVTVYPYAMAMDDRWSRDDVKRRHGKFKVSRDLVDNYPGAVAACLARCLVTRAECHYAYDAIEYTAMSPDFDRLEVGMVIPEYDVLFMMHHDLSPVDSGLGPVVRAEFHRFQRLA